jgi:hypothetical protein
MEQLQELLDLQKNLQINLFSQVKNKDIPNWKKKKVFMMTMAMKTPSSISEDDVQELIQDNINSIIQELSELRDSVDWKSWKQGHFNHQNAMIEMIDIQHFMNNIYNLLGMNAETICKMYKEKNELNIKRQEEGYLTGEYKKVDEFGIEDNMKLASFNQKNNFISEEQQRLIDLENEMLIAQSQCEY